MLYKTLKAPKVLTDKEVRALCKEWDTLEAKMNKDLTKDEEQATVDRMSKIETTLQDAGYSSDYF